MSFFMDEAYELGVKPGPKISEDMFAEMGSKYHMWPNRPIDFEADSRPDHYMVDYKFLPNLNQSVQFIIIMLYYKAIIIMEPLHFLAVISTRGKIYRNYFSYFIYDFLGSTWYWFANIG